MFFLTHYNITDPLTKAIRMHQFKHNILAITETESMSKYTCALIMCLYIHAVLLMSSPWTIKVGTVKLSVWSTLASRDVSYIFQRRSTRCSSTAVFAWIRFLNFFLSQMYFTCNNTFLIAVSILLLSLYSVCLHNKYTNVLLIHRYCKYRNPEL